MKKSYYLAQSILQVRTIPRWQCRYDDCQYHVECGDYHSLKWYRDTSRVYVYSPVALFSNAEGSLMDRYRIMY